MSTAAVVETSMLADVMSGHVQTTAVLLTADDRTVRQRLGQRESEATLDEHIARIQSSAAVVEVQSPMWVHRLPATARTVADIAEDVVQLAGWTG